MPKVKQWLTKRNILITLSLILFAVALYFIVPVSVPIILALLFALMVEPLVRWTMQRLKISRKLSVISVYIVVLGFLVVSLYYIMNTVIGKLIHWAKEAPSYLNRMIGSWNDFQTNLFQMTDSLPKEFVNAVQDEFDHIILSFRDSLVQLLNYDKILALAADIPSFLVSFLVFLIALFLFMLELPKVKHFFFKHLTEKTASRVQFMSNQLKQVSLGFLKAQLFVSIIIFIVALIGLLLIVPKYALVMALVIWIIDLVPILGSIIILGPWSIYAFIAGDTALGTKLAILAIILLIIRRTVEPKVMGSQIGLSPLPTLIAMFIGLKLFGFLGLIIGPLLVIMYTTAKEAGLINIQFKI